MFVGNLNHFLIFGKNRITGNPKDIITLVKSLINGEYWQYKKPVSGDQAYKGNGYIPCSTVPTDTIVKDSEQIYFDKSTVSKDWYKHMQKIFEFCKTNNLELYFIAIPESKFKIWDTINYQEYYDFIKAYVTAEGFPYYDFNLSNNLELIRSDFYDDEHLNYIGAKKFTECFNTLLKTPIQERDTLFYSTIEQKKLSEPDTIAGFVTQVSDDGKSVTFKPVTNNNNNQIQYTFTISYENNYEIKTSSKPISTVNFPLRTQGTIFVQVRLNDLDFCGFNYSFNTTWIK